MTRSTVSRSGSAAHAVPNLSELATRLRLTIFESTAGAASPGPTRLPAGHAPGAWSSHAAIAHPAFLSLLSSLVHALSAFLLSRFDLRTLLGRQQRLNVTAELLLLVSKLDTSRLERSTRLGCELFVVRITGPCRRERLTRRTNLLA